MTAPDIQQEIERTRERLGETVDELAARADVTARARAKGAEMKARAAEMKTRARGRWPLAAAAAGAVIIGSVLLWRRRTR
jgi:hypothetical protein